MGGPGINARSAQVEPLLRSTSRIVDLSVTLTEGGGEPLPPKIAYHDHSWGASRMALAPLQDPRSRANSVRRILTSFLTRKRIRKDAFPGGMALAWERVRTETHHGTHIDAPWHYGPTTAGQPARTID